MKISRYILYTTRLLNDREIPVGKTILQKMLYFLSGSNRNDYFKAYLYGPYSKAIDVTMDSLLANGELQKSGTTLTTQHEVVADSRDATRISALINAIVEKGLTTTGPLANTAKVHMFYKDNDKDDDGLVDFIRQRSRFLGWKELGETEPDKLREYLQHAKEIDVLVTL